MGLLTDAKGLLAAATILADSGDQDVMQPTYYLLGHAIEVALKSDILAHGGSLRRLKKNIGHDLTKAARRIIAARRDPISQLVADHMAEIDLLNVYYQAKEFEYRVTGFKRYPPHDTLLSFLRRIIPMIEPQALKVYPAR